MSLGNSDAIDAIKLHRFILAEDKITKFYLFALNGECNHLREDILDAKIDGVITNLSSIQQFLNK